MSDAALEQRARIVLGKARLVLARSERFRREELLMAATRDYDAAAGEELAAARELHRAILADARARGRRGLRVRVIADYVYERTRELFAAAQGSG